MMMRTTFIGRLTDNLRFVLQPILFHVPTLFRSFVAVQNDFGRTRHLTPAFAGYGATSRPSPPTPLAERENHRPSFKKSNAHFNEVQETAIAIKTRELQAAHERCSFFPQSGIRMRADYDTH